MTKVFFKKEPYWRVRLGKRFTGGSVHLKHFKELGDAPEFIFGTKGEDALSDLAQIHTGAVKIRSRFGNGGFILTPGQLAEAQDAFRRLPEKVSLTEILNDWFKRRAPVGGVKLTKTVAAEFLVSRSAIGVRSRTLVMYESQLRKINEEFGDIPIADIERSSIEDWIAESEWSPRTRKNFLVCLTTLFNFAINREYCSTNTAGKIARPILDDSVRGTLTVPQAKALLETASVGIPKDKKKEAFEPRPKMVADAPAPTVSAPPLPTVDARFPCRIADGVWIIPDKRTPLVPNIGIVEGSKSVLVIDAGFTLESGRDVFDAARAIAGQRDLILTVTHAHPEHTFGAQAFQGHARIYYNKLQRDYLARDGEKLLAGFRTMLPPGRGSLLDGVKVTLALISVAARLTSGPWAPHTVPAIRSSPSPIKK